MTRKKRSRKVANNGTPRLSKEKLRELRALKEQRVKKHKGHKPGSRNAPEVEQETLTTRQQRDPRAGSKKPIALVPEDTVVSNEVKINRSLEPQAQLKKSAPTMTPEEELAMLESDEKLMSLLDRYERGELLTGKDAKYFNKGIARHQALCELLGIDDEVAEEDMPEDTLDQFTNDDLAQEWLDDDWDDEEKS